MDSEAIKNNKMYSIDVHIMHFDNGATIFSNIIFKESLDYDFGEYLFKEIYEKGKKTSHFVGIQEVTFVAHSQYKKLFIDFGCHNSEADDFKEYFESREFEKLVNESILSYKKEGDS